LSVLALFWLPLLALKFQAFAGSGAYALARAGNCHLPAHLPPRAQRAARPTGRESRAAAIPA